MDMNRRTFLKAGAATALGLALSGAFPTKTTAHAEEAAPLPEDSVNNDPPSGEE